MPISRRVDELINKSGDGMTERDTNLLELVLEVVGGVDGDVLFQYPDGILRLFIVRGTLCGLRGK